MVVVLFLAQFSPPVQSWMEEQLALVIPLTPTSTVEVVEPTHTYTEANATDEPSPTEPQEIGTEPPTDAATDSTESSPETPSPPSTPMNVPLGEVFEVAARTGADVKLHAEPNSSLSIDYTQDCQHRTEPGTLGMKITYDVAFGTSAYVSFQWPGDAPLNLSKSFFIKLHFSPLDGESHTIGIILIDSYDNHSAVQQITSPYVDGWYDPALELSTFGVSLQAITEIRIALDRTETKSLRGSLCVDWITFE